MPTDWRTQLFWEHVPRAFVERSLRCLFDAYRAAADFCDDFAMSERVNLRPFYRRAIFERDWRALAESFTSRGVNAEAIRFEGKGFWYHTKVVCNNVVALTQSPVKNSEDMVNAAKFRTAYAQRYNQIWLIPDAGPKDIPEERHGKSLLYGVLIYGRAPYTPRVPGFAFIRFPRADFTAYHVACIDLFDEFPEVVQEKTASISWHDEPEDFEEVEPELLEDENIGG